MAITSEPKTLPPESLLLELDRRRAGLARHMTRAVMAEVHWDDSTGAPPEPAAIARACEAGLDLFITTARESRPPTHEELRRVAQLGLLQARGSQSVEPILTAYRIAARVAWEAILRAWRQQPEVSADALLVTANYVFTALDQVAAQVTHTYLIAREQHLLRGTRARDRLFHSLISDTFDSELALQKQALALNLSVAPTYVAAVFKLLNGRAEAERGSESLAQIAASMGLPPRTLHRAIDPHTLAILWPADSQAAAEAARRLVGGMQAAADRRGGKARLRIRAGLGGYHPGLHGVSRSYLEAQQAIEVGRRLRPEGGLHHYDEVVPYLVLSQNPLLSDRYIRHSIGRLLDADVRARGSLLDTLEAYLREGSIKDAAAALHLHRHTVIYRLGKVRERLDGDLDSPAVRLHLQLALDLRKLL
ncbi:MAG: PucR family transcriptional regulator [Candidatus Dormibacteraceae bacterium]